MTHADHRIDALPKGYLLQSYRIERVMGSGAFGITYLAQHGMLNTWHVIKEYLPDCGVREQSRSTVRPKSASDKELFDWGLNCFYEEARLLHKISHPNIVKVTDLFEANGTAYFVMPYLKGFTLHEWMKRNPSPSQAKLEAIFVPLLEGLKFIHDKGLLYRDVKPENIFITENFNPVLIDFGSARLAIGQKSKTLTQVLTPHFAPWEQYRSKGTFTPALDLYGLAACMYQAITRMLPEEAPERIEEDTQPKLAGSEYEKKYSLHFLRAIDKSLCVYARDRHQDGFELQRDLLGTGQVSSGGFDEQNKAKTVQKKIDYASPGTVAPSETSEQRPVNKPAYYGDEISERDKKVSPVVWGLLALSIILLIGIFWPKINAVWQVSTVPPDTQATLVTPQQEEPKRSDFMTAEHIHDLLQNQITSDNISEAQVVQERRPLGDPNNLVNGISIEIGYIEPTSIGSTFLRWKVNNKTEKIIEFNIKSYGVFDGMQYSDSRGAYKVFPHSSTQDPLFSIKIDNHELIFSSSLVRFYIEFEDITRQIEGTAEMKFNGNELRRYLVGR